MSVYKRFKGVERSICNLLGVERTGHLGGADGSGEWLAVEVKTRKTLPGWLHAAVNQAKGNAGPGQLALTVLHQERQPYLESFVVLRLGDFLDHFGQDPMAGASEEERAILTPDQVG